MTEVQFLAGAGKRLLLFATTSRPAWGHLAPIKRVLGDHKAKSLQIKPSYN